MGRPTVRGEPSSNKRDAVFAAAVRCFATHGLNGATMRHIAAAAGLTEGTLYHYFPSKRALIKAAFRWSAFDASSVSDALRAADTPLRERLLRVGEDFLATLRRDPDWTRVVIREALRNAPNADPNPVRAALISLASERTRVLAAVLRDEAAAGRIRPCNPRRVADLLFRALIGHFVAESIAGRSQRNHRGDDPFVVHLVATITTDLTHGGPVSLR